MSKGVDRPLIVMLLASKMDSCERMGTFVYMLRSIDAQVVKPDYFFVSMYVNEELQNIRSLSGLSTRQWYADAFPKRLANVDVCVLSQNTPKTQFQQLGDLVKRIPKWIPAKDISRTWVTFIDDDDLLSPHRTATFIDTIMTFNVEQLATVSRIIFTQSLDGKQAPGFSPTDTAQIDDAIKNGTLKLTRSISQTSELHVSCIPLTIVQQFFATATPKLLANRFCDMHLAYFVSTMKQYNSVFIENSTWMYYYRYAGQEYPSVTAPSAEDYPQYINEMLQVPCLREKGKEMLVSYIAHIRKTINEG